MTDNRALRNRDMKRGRMDGRYTRYKGYLEREEDHRRMDRMGHPENYSMNKMGYKPYTNDMTYDYARNSSNDMYGYDRMDYEYDGHENSEKKYHEDLKRWSEKLKKKDRFNLSKQDVINHAKQMGVKFEEFSEDEFYVAYLMQVTDHPQAYNEPRSYIARAKEWLMDDDVEVSPSEKLCIYYYYIVKGEGAE